MGILNATEISHISTSTTQRDIQLAIKPAPMGSVAETQALASRVIFCAAGRHISIAAALDALPISITNENSHILQKQCKHLILSLIQPTIESVCTTSVRISLRSAILLERAKEQAPAINHSTVALLASLGTALEQDDVSLLGFAAAYQCLRRCTLLKLMPDETRVLAGWLRALVGNKWSYWSEVHGVPDEIIERCVRVCGALSRDRENVRM
jgi:hypothetical protein